MLTLTEAELEQLTGYKYHARQLRFLRERLRIFAVTRPDGMPLVTHAQVEAALGGSRAANTAQPRWTKTA